MNTRAIQINTNYRQQIKLLLFTILCWGLFPFQALAQDEAANDVILPIIIAPNKTADYRIFARNQEVHIDGTANKDIVSIKGTVFVKGEVNADISVLGGSVHLADSAVVTGAIICIGGQVIQDGNPTTRKITSLFAPTNNEPPPWLSSAWSRVAFFFGHSLVLFLLVTLLFYSFPNQVNEAGFQLSQDLVRAAIIGATIWAALLTLFFLSFLLMVVGVGFLVFMFTFAITTVLALFGTAVVFYQGGQGLESISGGKIPLNVAILIAVMIASALLYVPLLGDLMILLVAIFGVGIVMETRFGTNKQWFTRKARYWGA